MTEKQPRRVLIVDDDRSLLDALRRSLTDAGFDIVAHNSFEDARHAIRSSIFDIVLTDVRLGTFNGLQLAILARQQQPKVRIIVFSGFDDPVLRKEAGVIGAEYLVKPVSGSQLAAILRQSPRTA